MKYWEKINVIFVNKNTELQKKNEVLQEEKKFCKKK